MLNTLSHTSGGSDLCKTLHRRQNLMSASGGLAMVVVAISISIYFRNPNLPQETNPWAQNNNVEPGGSYLTTVKSQPKDWFLGGDLGF
jgi:hypothetical protein